MAMPQRPKTKTKQNVKQKKIPRLRKPEGMTLEEWQIALRAQFGAAQDFGLKNVGEHSVFSEFIVTNPATGGAYRVTIRGQKPGDNHCTCPDFAVNTLGTCKHVEFTLSRLRKRRGALAAFRAGFRPAYSEVYLRYGAERRVMFRSAEGCPEWLKRLASQYFEPNGALKPKAYGSFENFLKAASRDGHEIRCYEDAIGFVAQVRDNARRAKEVAQAFPKGIESPRFNRLLKTQLYPYQRQGALFAAAAGRSIIADEMGLGKTIQAIAAAEILADVSGTERALIVCPTSLKHQWKQEIEKFSGRTAEVVEGLQPARAMVYRNESFFKITNYDVVHRDEQAIRSWAPDLIILDEAQRIKNWKTRTARTVKKLPSEHAIVLTGTPLENRLEELHSIVEFVDRHRLGPAFRFLAEHQQTDDNGRVTGYKNLREVAKTIAPILLRRRKSEVLKDLPERLEKRFLVPMTPQQMAHHDEYREMVARLAAKWRRHGFLSEADQRRLRIALQYMRMSCNSTYLLDQKTDHGVKADEFAALLSDIYEEPGTKVVVFSQWVRMHELLSRRMEEHNWSHVIFHGGVDAHKRRDLIKRFKEDEECRAFLSTDAGGVGLNLQNASVIVNMDQPWNPAVLEQRIGRVHRLGQHRPVRVVHFVSKGTIEEGMLEVLSFKKSLFTGVLDGGDDEIFMGKTRLRKFMESVERVTDSIPAAMPEQTTTAPVDELSEVEAVCEEERAEVEAAHVQEVSSPGDPYRQSWSDAVTAGLAFIEKLGAALSGSGTSGENGGIPGGKLPLVQRDERTGQEYLRVPMPSPDTFEKLSGFLKELLRK